MFFTQAMVLYPHVQRKAHQELDSVIGPTRLPEFYDIDNLPYIQAIVLETLRWRPAAPYGVPHSIKVDDVYEGFHIPRGSVIIPVSCLPSSAKPFCSHICRIYGAYEYVYTFLLSCRVHKLVFQGHTA